MIGPVTIFGGTGFLGRRAVRRLREANIPVRVASRHAERGRRLFGNDNNELHSIAADIHDDRSIERALAGAAAAVNAVSLYVERGDETFQSVHVTAAERVARQAGRAGIQHLAHVSGIGSDPQSSSKYIKARGEGEQVVRAAFPDAALIRPAVMFGPGDAFVGPIARLLKRLPVYPLFGKGTTRLQPAFVDDVAQAIAAVTERPNARGKAFQCAGPRVYSYEELLRTVADAMHVRARLIPMPFAAWHIIAALAEWLPSPPITRNQVELMEVDNVASADAPGFSDLGIAPRSLGEVLPAILTQC
jgi:uncharacterized protein YbjT (DUF2867 family)